MKLIYLHFFLSIILCSFFCPNNDQSFRDEFLKNIQKKGLSIYTPYELAFALDEFCFAINSDTVIYENWKKSLNKWKDSKANQFYYYHSYKFFTFKLDKAFENKMISRNCYNEIRNALPEIEEVKYESYATFLNDFIKYAPDLDIAFMFTFIVFSDEEVKTIEISESGNFDYWANDMIYEIRMNYYPKDFINQRIANFLTQKYKNSELPYIKKVLGIFQNKYQTETN